MSARLRVTAVLLATALVVLPSAGVRAATGAWQVPTPVVKTLPNGLTVAIYSDDRLPIVEVQLLVEAGSVHEPPGAAGLANLTLKMIGQGTTSRSRVTFAQDAEDLGTAFGGTVGREFSTLSSAFLAQDFEKGLELLGDAMANPLLDEAPLAAIKEQITESLTRLRHDSAALGVDHLWALVQAGHPYERPPQGGLRSVSALDISQVRSFHRERYRPDRALLAIAGDVTPERGFRAAEDALGRWAGKASEFQPVAPSPPAETGRVRIVDAPELAVAELYIGCTGPARASKDYEPLRLGAQILQATAGGPATESGVDGMRDGGVFWIISRVPVDSVGTEVKRLNAALQRWTTEPTAANVLESVRGRTVAALPLQFETRAGMIGKWTGAAFNRLPAAAITDEAARIGILTGEDVRSAAATWVKPGRMMVVAVGPAGTLRPQLESAGAVEVVSDEVAMDIVQTPSTTTAPPSAAQLERGRALVTAAVAAHGGLTRMRGIKDSRFDGDMRIIAGDEEMKGQAVQVRKEPERFLFSTDFTGLKTVQVLDGDKAWSGHGEPVVYTDLDSVAAGGLRAGFRSDILHLLLTAADSSARVAWRGQERLDTGDADVVEVIARDGERRVLFLDTKTHRLRAMDQSEVVERHLRIVSHSVRRHYADFRDVNGILWPFSEERSIDGQRVMTLQLQRVAFNTGVKDAAFKKPSTPQANRRR